MFFYFRTPGVTVSGCFVYSESTTDLDGLGAGKNDTQAWGSPEAFLAGGHHHVNSPIVHTKLFARYRAHGVQDDLTGNHKPMPFVKQSEM